jgi:hypothetical protein
MTKKEFNTKYKEYIENGREGLTFESPACAHVLDNILKSIIDRNDNFLLGNVTINNKNTIKFNSNLSINHNEVIQETLTARYKRELKIAT